MITMFKDVLVYLDTFTSKLWDSGACRLFARTFSALVLKNIFFLVLLYTFLASLSSI